MIKVQNRNLHLDGLKFFLVCLVVLGHCIQPFRYDYTVFGWLYGLIYSFHMPLFVILSGYFFTVYDHKKECGKLLRLAETFLWVTLAFWLIGGRAYSYPLLRLGACPSWYLLSLIFWRAVSYLLLQKYSVRRILAASVFVAVVTYIVLNKGEGILSAMRTVQFYPYFMLGYAIRSNAFVWKHPKPITLFVILSICILCICTFSNYALYTQEFQSIGLLHWCNLFSMSILEGGGGYLFVRFVSLVTSYAVYLVVRLPNRWAQYGTSSLLIYSIHTMSLPLVYKYCTAWWQSLTIGFATILFSMLVHHTAASSYLLNPITTIIHQINKKV